MPFSQAQFFEVFRRYNEAVWPAQPLLVLLAVVSVVLAFSPSRALRRTAVLIVAAFWLWTGVAYHWLFFADINPLARIFALLCIAEAIFLAFSTTCERAPRRFIGTAIVLIALVGYPAIGLLAGHRYPAFPTFGAPCPTTIFTFGFLGLLSLRRALLVIPLLWTVIATAAAISLGVPQDFMLPLAAVIAVLPPSIGRARSAAAEGPRRWI